MYISFGKVGSISFHPPYYFTSFRTSPAITGEVATPQTPAVGYRPLPSPTRSKTLRGREYFLTTCGTSRATTRTCH